MVNFLDKIGVFVQETFNLEPQYGVIILGIFLAILPPLYKGRLDNRLESYVEGLDYSKVVLSVSGLLAYYYQFGADFGPQLIGIVAGFIIGSTVNGFFSDISGFDE